MAGPQGVSGLFDSKLETYNISPSDYYYYTLRFPEISFF
jgi:hypothetical protein